MAAVPAYYDPRSTAFCGPFKGCTVTVGDRVYHDCTITLIQQTEECAKCGNKISKGRLGRWCAACLGMKLKLRW